jgi:hypothetical protein
MPVEGLLHLLEALVVLQDVLSVRVARWSVKAS